MSASGGVHGGQEDHPEATPRHARLGRYRLIREIGRGGMGVVYEAEQVDLGRRVALKVLEAHVTLSPECVTRFQREAAAAASLHHPAILPVHTVGEDNGTHYFSMELVEGCSLEDVLQVLRGEAEGEAGSSLLMARFQADRFREGARILADVAEALQHAHEHHILHRDVKPSNILLDQEGRAVLIDFGLSRDEGLPSVTQTGQLVGSPYYLAPEQIQGLGRLDHRVDVYALGVVLYEVLTLRRPFEGQTTQEVLTRIAGQEPESPRHLAREAPGDLVAVAAQAMSRDPGRRYSSAGAMAQDLRRFRAGRPVQARQSGAWSRAWLRLRRRAFVARSAIRAAVATFLLVVGVLAVNAWWTRTGTLHLTTTQVGVRAELFAGPDPRDPSLRTLTLPAAPQELRAGIWSLRLRAPGHDWLRLEDSSAIPVRAGVQSARTVFLSPLRTALEQELGEKVRELRRLPGSLPGGVTFVAAQARALVGVRGDGSVAWHRDLSQDLRAWLLRSVAATDAMSHPVLVGCADGRVLALNREGTVQDSWHLQGAVRCLAWVQDQTWVGTDTGQVVELGANGLATPLCVLADPVLALVGTAPDAGVAALAATAAGLSCLGPSGQVLLHHPGAGAGHEPLALIALDTEAGTPRAVMIRKASGLLTVHDGIAPVAEVALQEAVTAATPLALPDGSPGLAVATASGRTLLLDRRGQTGWEVSLGSEVRALATGDLDGDGTQELAVISARRLVVLTATGEWRLESEWAEPPTQVCFADLDGNGADEMVVALEGSLRALAPDRQCRAEVRVEEPGRVLALAHAGSAFLVQSGTRRMVRISQRGALQNAWDAPGPISAACVVDPDGEPLLLVGCTNGVCGLQDMQGQSRFLVDLKSPILLLAAPRQPTPDFLAGAVTGEGRLLALDAEGTPSFALEPKGKGRVQWIHAGDLHRSPGPELLAVTDNGSWFVLSSLGVPLLQRRLAQAPERVAVARTSAGREPRIAFAFADDLLEIRDLQGALRESYQFEVPITALATTLDGVDPIGPPADKEARQAFWVGLESGELLILDGEGAVRSRRFLSAAPSELHVLPDHSLFAVLPGHWQAFTRTGERRWSLPHRSTSLPLAVAVGKRGAQLLAQTAPAHLAFYSWGDEVPTDPGLALAQDR